MTNGQTERQTDRQTDKLFGSIVYRNIGHSSEWQLQNTEVNVIQITHHEYLSLPRCANSKNDFEIVYGPLYQKL